jgi:large subunit ribosomal protein L4
LWRGGGITHGPQPHDYNYKLPRKVKQLARISVLSSKREEEQLKVVEDFSLEQAKTKEMFSVVKAFGLEDRKTLLLVSEYDKDILLASRNIKNFKVAMASDASTYDLLDCKALLVTESSVKKLEGIL